MKECSLLSRKCLNLNLSSVATAYDFKLKIECFGLFPQLHKGNYMTYLTKLL